MCQAQRWQPSVCVSWVFFPLTLCTASSTDTSSTSSKPPASFHTLERIIPLLPTQPHHVVLRFDLFIALRARMSFGP